MLMWEKKILKAIRNIPFFGGLVELLREGDQIIGLHWGWIENGERQTGWFNENGRPIDSPKER